MKITFVSAYPPARGNLAEYGNYIIERLSKDKSIEKITVLANEARGAKRIEKSGKLKIVRCWKDNSLAIPYNVLKEIPHDTDIVHFNLHMMSWGKGRISNFLGAMTPYLSKLTGKKVIVTLHSIVEVADVKELGIKASPFDIFGSYIATKFLLSCNRTTVTLKKFVTVLEGKYNRKNIVHIPHGTLGRQISKIKTGGNNILTFGFWRDNKNLPFAIEIFEEVLKKEKLSLIVAGDSHPNFPGYLEKIKLLYKDDKITFKGYIHEKDLKKTFLKSTVIMLPYSTATGTSGTINLAASYGKPVIVSDLPEMRDLLKNENLRLILVQKKNKKAFASAILKLMKDRNLQRQIAEHNLKSAEKNSFGYVAEKFSALYKEVLYD